MSKSRAKPPARAKWGGTPRDRVIGRLAGRHGKSPLGDDPRHRRGTVRAGAPMIGRGARPAGRANPGPRARTVAETGRRRVGSGVLRSWRALVLQLDFVDGGDRLPGDIEEAVHVVVRDPAAAVCEFPDELGDDDCPVLVARPIERGLLPKVSNIGRRWRTDGDSYYRSWTGSAPRWQWLEMVGWGEAGPGTYLKTIERLEHKT